MASFPGQQAKAEHIMPLQSETPHQCGNGLSDCLYGEKPQSVCDNQFWLYDLIITNEVLAFMPLEQDYIYFK